MEKDRENQMEINNDIPEATADNTDLGEPLYTAGYIKGWNDCRKYILDRYKT